LLLQNARFYEAFEHADMSALDDVWDHASTVKCIHPGWHLLEGWAAIRESWRNIFSTDSDMKVSLRNISAEVRGTLGIVTLIEEISYRTPHSIRTGMVMATNIFELRDEGWKMIHHHGSPMLVPDEESSDETYRYN
jgi:ketosteroid isomerase-like protein